MVYKDVFRKYVKVRCMRLIVVPSGKSNNINLTQVPLKFIVHTSKEFNKFLFTLSYTLIIM